MVPLVHLYSAIVPQMIMKRRCHLVSYRVQRTRFSSRRQQCTWIARERNVFRARVTCPQEHMRLTSPCSALRTFLPLTTNSEVPLSPAGHEVTDGRVAWNSPAFRDPASCTTSSRAAIKNAAKRPSTLCRARNRATRDTWKMTSRPPRSIYKCRVASKRSTVTNGVTTKLEEYQPTSSR